MRKTGFQPVVFQPAAYRGLQQGISQMVGAVRPTLGPLPRSVAVERTMRAKTPELLDNGALIARRMIGLADRDADMGAMFLRHVLWQVHERVGDGTATTAVLLESVFDQGVRYIASGGNAMRLCYFLREGLALITEQLSRMAQPVEGQRQLAQVAESVCYDAPLATMLGEIFDIVGEYGQLDIRSGQGRELERQYVEGMYWNSGLVSRQMIGDPKTLKVEIQNAAVLITDLELEDPQPLVTLLRQVHQAGIPGLVVIAKKVSDHVTALLLSASADPAKFRAFAVKTPGAALTDQISATEDLAVLTGGRRLVATAGDTLKRVQLTDLGHARRAWADRYYFGIVGGRGDPRVMRQHIASLRAAFERVTDPAVRRGLQERIGKLMGGSAVLFVGGLTGADVETRKALAQRTADAVRSAVREGVVPGGGVAFLACRAGLQERQARSVDSDERAGYRILVQAIEAPIRTILHNAGQDAGRVMADIALASDGYGCDVRSGKIVHMVQAGIWDPVAVLKMAVHSAVSSAALALTTDVLVHHKKPQQTTEP